ncbi:MAG: CaiB/BaiF CoA-transferase family protein [Burkholderiaceae bacterium]|nr:CaiB/BaiF CoA-transferase family protein [Burkholderiaceae bacterium]
MAPHTPQTSPPLLSTGPLRGVRIVEFAAIGPVPLAAMQLADKGAEIVRIDRPGAAAWEPRDIIGRGRRATVQLDLKKPADQAEALRLLRGADALIEGMRPGVMERLGLSPEAVAAVNPRLVYGRMTGWGQAGPLADSAGHDINYISLSGALAAIGTADRPPVPPLNLVGDYGGGTMFLIAGLLAALLEARTSGRGQVVDAAMCDGVASLMGIFMAIHAKGQWQAQRQSNMLDGGAHFYGTYECSDGKHMSVGAIEPQFYRLLRDKLGLDDPLFDRQHERALWPELRGKVAAVFIQKPQAHWRALFDGTDACVAPVLQLTEAHLHPHLAARQTYMERDGVVQPAPAPRFSRTPSATPPPQPEKPWGVDQVLAAWESQAN